MHSCRNAKRQGLSRRICQPLSQPKYPLSEKERSKFLEEYLKGSREEQKKNNDIVISPEDKLALIKAMKIGYYKEFNKQGLITDQQLEMLISLQDRPDIQETA